MRRIKKIQQTSEYNKKRRRLTDAQSKLVVFSAGRGQHQGGGVEGTNCWM